MASSKHWSEPDASFSATATSRHNIFHNPRTEDRSRFPRHREVNERLARKIIKDLTENRDEQG
jgi:hypothetical protein